MKPKIRLTFHVPKEVQESPCEHSDGKMSQEVVDEVNKKRQERREARKAAHPDAEELQI